MNALYGAVAALAAGALLAPTAGGLPTPAVTPDSAVATPAPARSGAPASYTFQMDIVMTMRHFPWLHFKMEGQGDYRRGHHYIVHLTHKPSFASKMHDIDLSMIDPSMWPNRYRAQPIGRQGDDTVFALQAIEPGSLASATVALNPVSGAHWVDATYSDGMHVHMVLSSDDVDGFLLPVTLTADVDYPHMPLSADATFTNYSITAPPA